VRVGPAPRLPAGSRQEPEVGASVGAPVGASPGAGGVGAEPSVAGGVGAFPSAFGGVGAFPSAFGAAPSGPHVAAPPAGPAPGPAAGPPAGPPAAPPAAPGPAGAPLGAPVGAPVGAPDGAPLGAPVGAVTLLFPPSPGPAAIAAVTPTPPRTRVAATAAPMPARRAKRRRPAVRSAAGAVVGAAAKWSAGYCSVGWSFRLRSSWSSCWLLWCIGVLLVVVTNPSGSLWTTLEVVSEAELKHRRCPGRSMLLARSRRLRFPA